jgi:hypothetical protein
MGRLKFILFMFYTILIAVITVAICRKCLMPDPVVIKTTETKYNTVYKDTSKMQVYELQAELDCYYHATPELDIKKGGGNDYVLSASLCEREWQKIATVRPREPPRNMIITGPLISTRGGVGAWAQYYRLYGQFGFGGGISLCQDSAQAQAGVLWMW